MTCMGSEMNALLRAVASFRIRLGLPAQDGCLLTAQDGCLLTAQDGCLLTALTFTEP